MIFKTHSVSTSSIDLRKEQFPIGVRNLYQASSVTFLVLIKLDNEQKRKKKLWKLNSDRCKSGKSCNKWAQVSKFNWVIHSYDVLI